MTAISPDGHAEPGEWDVWVSKKPGCAVLTVTSDQGVLFRIMVSMGRVEAAHALPVEHGTAWARSRRRTMCPMRFGSSSTRPCRKHDDPQ